MLEILKNETFELEEKSQGKTCQWDCGDGSSAIFTGLF